MQRRAFVTQTALAGAGAALEGCASLGGEPLGGSAPLLLDPEEIARRWAEVERSREAILARPPLALDELLPGGRSRGRLAGGGELARKGIRSLLLAGAFRDLPEDARVHPVVQASLFDAMPEFDESVFGMKARLQELSTTERADISRELRSDPSLAERVMVLLDDEAAAVGVSDARRLHMRALGLTICDRLHQSADQLVGEYDAKLEKIAARHGSHAELERRLAASLGARAYESLRARTFRAAATFAPYDVAFAQRKLGTDGKPAGKSGKKKGILTAGGIALGISVLEGGTAILVAAVAGGIGGAVPGLIIGTIAGVHFLTGLILLIVGAAIS